MSLLNRFPKVQQIIPVYAVGLALLYSWTIYFGIKAFSTNWSLFLGVGDILSLFAYMLAGGFLESVILIGILLALSFVLPGALFKNKFILRGSILTIAFLVSIMVFYLRLSQNLVPNSMLEHIATWIKMFLLSSLVLLILGEFKPFGKLIEAIADRCIVFLYLYLPLTFLSLLTVLLRNIR